MSSLPARILVLSDVPESSAVLRAVLEEEGHEVVSADGLGQGLARAAEAPVPAVILIDGSLSDGTQLEACRRFRALPGHESTSIIAIVPRDADTQFDELLSAGISDFLRRPLLPHAISVRVRVELRAAQMRHELRRNVSDLELLLDLTRRFASTLDVKAILFDLVDQLAAAIGVPRASLVLVDQDRSKGLVIAASDDRSLHDLEIDLDGYPEIREVLRAREPLVIAHAPTHPLLEPVRETLEAHGVGSVAIFPLLFEDQFIGVLFLRAALEAQFGEREIRFADTVAHATAVALRNARLFEHMRDETRRAADQKQRAERAVADLKLYEDLYEHVSEGILLVASDGRIDGANPSAREMLVGCSPLEGKNLSDLGTGEGDRVVLRSLIDALRDRHRVHGLEFGVSCAPGTRIVSAGASPLTGGGGVISFRDMTENRRVEAELRQTKDYLENLIDSSADCIVACDMRGDIILWNQAAERVTGYGAEEAIGRLHVTRMYPEGGAYDIMRLLRSDDHGGAGRLESHRVEVISTEGERIPVNLSAAILYENGREVGTMGIFTDLRERLRIEQKLSRAQDKLLRSEKQVMLAELAGTAAHELNQPLTSVMGYSELLKRKIPPDDGNYRAVDIIYRESERMAEIVRKIGRITRYETKEYLGNTRIVDLDRSSEEETP